MIRRWPEETEALREDGCAFDLNGWGLDCEGRIELAHITKRRFDRPRNDGATVYVEPESILPLCTYHHAHYDTGQIDVLSLLSTQQQLRAIEDYGSITKALERIAPSISRRINGMVEPETGRQAAA